MQNKKIAIVFNRRKSIMDGVTRYVIEMLRNANPTHFNLDLFIVEKGLSVLHADWIDDSNDRLDENGLTSDRGNLKATLENLKPDLIHYPWGNVPKNWRKFSDNNIISLHGAWRVSEFEERTEKQISRGKILKQSIKEGINSLSAVVTVSEFSKSDVSHYYELQPKLIHTIHHGTNLNFFKPLSNSEQSERFTINDIEISRPYIFHTGNCYAPRKNIMPLLEAFNAIKQNDHLPHKLVLTNDRIIGEEHNRINDFIHQNKLIDDVLFLGEVTDDELLKLYQNAFAYAFPSLYEGFGLPILEAMACGIPVITSNTTAMPEVAGDAALLIDPRRPYEIEMALRNLINMPALRIDLINRGLDRTSKLFSWTESANKHLDLYHKLTL